MLIKTFKGFGNYKTLGPESNCSYFYQFSMKAAAKVTERSPCTNRPVKCDLCEQIYWSYNLEIHYKSMHKNPNTNQINYLITKSLKKKNQKF